MRKAKHKLANAEQRHSVDPKTFVIPPREAREDLWPGDLVKLIFEDIGERLWVKVLKQNPDGSYDGFVTSEPLDASIDKGDNVHFNPEHITEIEAGHWHKLRAKWPGSKKPTLH